MKGHSNIELLKNAYEYWDENKEKAFENWMDLLSDDIKLKSLADGAVGMEFTQICNCKNDVLRYFEGLSAEWEMIYYKVDDYISEGNRVVAIGNCRWRFKKTGKEVETPKVDIVTFEDSKIIEFFELYDTAKVLACTQS